jgi:hypothetical protein
MKIIQLQRLCVHTHDNQGGLYINIEHISALIPYKTSTPKGETVFWCNVLLSNQVTYLTPFSVQEIYELILEAERLDKQPLV